MSVYYDNNNAAIPHEERDATRIVQDKLLVLSYARRINSLNGR